MPENKRQTELDILRLLATLAVIMIHGGLNPLTDNLMIKYMYRGMHAAIVWCVPVFFMISGRFFLDPERDVSAKKILTVYLPHIIVPFLVWSGVYTAYGLISGSYSHLSTFGVIAELLKENIMPFNTLMAYYRCAIMEVETKFKVLNEEFSLQYDRNPIESIKSRIKSMDGIFKKAKKKNIPITMEGIEEGIRDIAGVRVICSFPEDIYMLADCLLKQDDVVLVERKDYIKNPKPSGYRSLHLIIEIPIFLQNEKKMMKVEVQLRTIAMDFWASVEHKVRYKKNIPDSEAEQLAAELSSCADQIAAMDNKMEEIRRRIAEAEEREAENNPPKQPQTIGGVMLKKRLESGKFPFKK